MNSLFDWPFLLFIFAPPVVTLSLVSLVVWWKARPVQQHDTFQQHDTAEGILAAAVQSMPAERGEWGRAMLAELAQLSGTWDRIKFAISCARVALFPPTASAVTRSSLNPFQRGGIHCGMLSVALPALALPFLFLTTVVLDGLFHGSGGSTSHAVPAGVVGGCLLVGVSMLLSGLPLGLAGWYRGERFLWLSAIGPFLSVACAGYLWMFLYLFAVGPNGD